MTAGCDGVETAVDGVERVGAIEVAGATRVLEAIEHVCLDHRPRRRRNASRLAAEFGGDDLGDVLVFGDHLNFLVGEIAETEAVAEREHASCNGQLLRDATTLAPALRIRQVKMRC